MSKTPHIICIGSASQDTVLSGKAFAAKRDVREHKLVEQFPLGSKIEVDNVHYSVGGGALNASVTFARQGFNVDFVGKIGPDAAGAEVLRTLHTEGIGRSHVQYDRRFGTSYSTILSAPTGERVVLVYRGASHNIQAKDLPITDLKGAWFYVTSLAGNFDVLKKIIRHAKSIEAKVALAPGSLELAKPDRLRKLLPDVEVLLGNREELQTLFGAADIRDLLLTSFGLCPYIVVTDANKGCYVSDGDKIYHAGPYSKVKVVDRTGAGDAFGSGFVAGLAEGKSLAAAVTLASANATAVVQEFGSTKGILQGGRLKSLKVEPMQL